ncbi:hypothetical protein [Alcanivorax sp.]|uniref:hypothetical protein n=1 Tax=Alcanivorax sp. TaxID=1872427 RepID=UPI003A8E1AD1
MFSKHISMFQSDLRYWQRQGLDLLELLTSASLPASLLTENDERLDASAIQRLFEQAEKNSVIRPWAFASANRSSFLISPP